MDRPPQPNSSLSRNPSNVSWGTKIRGAIQIGHGVGEAIRGSLGASDLDPHHHASSSEIAQRGRHEIAQGLARIKGAATMLPPGPVYDRRHSYPTQQYQERPASAWSGRSTSAHHNRPNPPTATSPFEKFYEHPYPAEQDQDSGFAGLGAGIDPSRRKEANDRVLPAFMAPPQHPAPSLQTPYPMLATNSGHGTSRPSSAPHISHFQPGPSATDGMSSNSPFPSPRTAPPLPPRPSTVASYGRTPLDQQSAPSSINNHQLFIPPPVQRNTASESRPPILASPSSNNHRSLSTLVDRTKSIRLTGKGKGKEKEKQPEGNNKPGRIPSMSERRTRPASPNASNRVYPKPHQTLSAPSTPPPHQHESALETAGYDVLSYDAKDRYPHWPTEEERAAAQASRSRSQTGGRLEPVRDVRA
ncbi:hypothetical protein DFH07DRAFT_936641 [Mycena maculata]|uniref:Uncharacterized protein n=1 Tax=Mycena maculata TaxID=230809 RepID=A0AAD7NVJ5_9AGAR|nr:hypothetical protein DFH07DRAFT_936641 [Mycena maculata]